MYDDRLRRVAVGAAMVIASAMLVSACGGGSTGPEVASAGNSTSTASSSSESSSKASPLGYSRCMRAHGLKDFPDPNSNGGLGISAHPGSDLDPNSPLFQAAQQACKSLAPQAPTSGAGQAKAAKAILRYAQCMRAHGLKDFPDPSGQGMLSLKATPGSDLDPNNPQFQSADKACRANLPGGTGAPQTSSSGGSGAQ
jgi:hypothetical protein